jgi:pimeloyl-ACP methyl ester carboxylesterase
MNDVIRRKLASLRPRGAALKLTLNSLEKVAPRLAGRLAYGLFHRAARRPLSATEAAFLSEARRDDLRHGSLTVPVYSWGRLEAEAVLMIHGWSGNAGQFSELARAVLASGLRVVAFDAPGHGAAPGTSTTTKQMAEIAGRILRERGPFRGLVAHSFGAMVAGSVLRQHPGAVGRVILISGVFGSDTLLQGFQAVTGASDRVLAAFVDHVERVQKHSYWDYSGENLGPSRPVPTLLIHDQLDREVPPREAERYLAHWPGAELIWTRGLGHRRILKDQRVISRVGAALSV